MDWNLAMILAIGVFGGILPLFVRWTDRTLHAGLALSTGLFLGAVFLHLLPSLAQIQVNEYLNEHAGHDHGHEGHVHGDITLWIYVLAGVLAVYVFEALLLRTHDHDQDHADRHQHRSVGYAALMGLTVHALTSGVAYGAGVQEDAAVHGMFLAIMAHKGFEAFSLTTVFVLAEFSRKQVWTLALAFALVTPVGILLGQSLGNYFGGDSLGILTALAAGTFLYVSLCELLTEVFHHKEDVLIKLLLLGAGIAIMVVTHQHGI